ncbi:MAG: sigma-70 family RNA polymerase sigma factor, partial [Opitutaceae bacterium]
MSDSDAELLRRYVQDNSADAFATLVRRHLDLVYSVARRHSVSTSFADDVAQSVFIELARHAGRIKSGTPLVAWLHIVARRTALNASRAAARRRFHETSAAADLAMKPDASPPSWTAIEPLLDEAVESLPLADRTAVLLRFFENKNYREIGGSLGISDDAAQKRISRALEQLRVFFLRRGAPIAAAALAEELGAHAVVTAPAGLLAAISVPSFQFAAAATAVAMTTLQKSALVFAAVLLAGFGLYEAAVVHRQHNELTRLN